MTPKEVDTILKELTVIQKRMNKIKKLMQRNKEETRKLHEELLEIGPRIKLTQAKLESHAAEQLEEMRKL